MNLPELIDKLHSEQACRDHLKKVRWPAGIACPECGDMSVSHIRSRDIYECNTKECRKQFSVKSGTIFHGSHLPLRTWFLAIHRITESKKGVSANQLKRELGISYPTAWYMCHRIREALSGYDEPTLHGIVEADETFVKGKGLPKGEKAKTGGNSQTYTPVLGVKSRDSKKVRAKAVNSVSTKNVIEFLKENTGNWTEAIYTDQAHVYRTVKSFKEHKWVNHSKQYVYGDNIHTNGIESFWSLFKRGIIGQYHRVSSKHLQRYLDEFCWRQSQDEKVDLFNQALKKAVTGKHIKYSELTR